LLGQALDHILTQNAPKHWITQEKIEANVDGITVVGKADYFDPETGILGDWKSTSSWSYVFGGKQEWEKQLNCYAWLERQRGREVKKLVAQRLFRDWMARKSSENNYPERPFMEIEIPLWSNEKQDEYIKDQVHFHTMCPQPTECTPEQKWEKPTTYAVMKKGRKSALRVLESLDAAYDWIADNGHSTAYENGGIDVAERKGECTRCLNYCPVRSVCPFRK